MTGSIPDHNFRSTPNFSTIEEEVKEFWRQDQTFIRSVKQHSPSNAYVFYDGPPFATGLPHYGHLLGSTAKDVIGRYWTMKGFRVERVWGWDCHGLPIENMIEQQLQIKNGKKGIEELGIGKFNEACRAEVLRLDTEWEKIIERLGRWVDFAHNYKTMDNDYMESVWWGFKQLHDKGHIYEGKRVILYCPRCATPLSNFEIAMDNSYATITEPATTYKYPVVGQDRTYLLAWSTTPWNKLVTPALAVNPKLEYVKAQVGDEHYILARTRLAATLGDQVTVEETMSGQELTQLSFEPHYDFYPHRQPDEKFGVIVADNFVTDSEGTGVVTLAAYGEDDYRVMREHSIQISEHLDENGRLKPEIKPWAGLTTAKANTLIDEDLSARGLILKEESLTHSVPVCYRCNTRLYYAPVPAWFINIDQLRSDLLAANQHINWYPAHLKAGRFGKGIETAPDWNISRSRYWGTPMPVWRSADGQHTRVIGSVAELKEWAVDPAQANRIQDLHRQHLDKLEVWVDDQKTVKGQRISEVFDCWVESGSMPFASVHYPFEHQAEFEARYPAQFVSEYIAQTRAWFYTMHVMSVGIFGSHAVENILTTGTILAHNGDKMSKSKKNYPDPMLLINKHGADSLRLYLMSSSVMKSENINFDEQEVERVRKRVLLIWWNVMAFYKLVAGESAKLIPHPPESKHVLDKWLVSRVSHLVQQTTELMDAYDVVKSSRGLMSFIDELSTWYLRRSRDRLKANQDSAQATLGWALGQLAQLFAPFAPFISETLYQAATGQSDSVHLSNWPTTNAQLINDELEQDMARVLSLVELVHAQRQTAGIKLRQPLAAVTIKSQLPELPNELTAILQEEINVKKVVWQKAEQEQVELDTKLSPDLIAEGNARELIRAIQALRKTEQTKAGQVLSIGAPAWPIEWQAEIEQKTHSKLVKHSELAILNP